jgi:glucose-specific phosphotransferase system IIA component
MFGLLRNRNCKIVSPSTGKCIPIEEVHDNAFAQKLMGNGFAVIPAENLIVSPVDGEIVSVAKTKHAFGIRTKANEEVIVHVGIDTVNLNGTGFTCLQAKGDRIKAGTPLLRYDPEIMAEKNLDMTIIVVFIDSQENKINSDYFGKSVGAGKTLNQ